MNNSHVQIISIEELKIQASILLKKIKSAPDPRIQSLFNALPEFKNLNLEEIQRQVKRKHALKVIAIQNGFLSWNELKNNCEQLIGNTFVSAYIGGHLNKWFASYPEAKKEQLKNGGFLLPYKKQFFICDQDYIASLGLNPKDPNWSRIDFDWVKPANLKSWQDLYHQWLSIKEAK